LGAEIAANAFSLSQDAYGNYVDMVDVTPRLCKIKFDSELKDELLLRICHKNKNSVQG
jgi:hypothetical protein